ncbi:hypothetical protein T03_916 [Trichinella britovi]|uniref:Uncharacterized protein n=1 Tax=Trichinella britovi TaxID=45882 RepID=A0A0V1D0Q2_TRIBR|nr:hypothetical protein T03_916 [Trichinella britovi]
MEKSTSDELSTAAADCSLKIFPDSNQRILLLTSENIYLFRQCYCFPSRETQSKSGWSRILSFPCPCTVPIPPGARPFNVLLLPTGSMDYIEKNHASRSNQRASCLSGSRMFRSHLK